MQFYCLCKNKKYRNKFIFVYIRVHGMNITSVDISLMAFGHKTLKYCCGTILSYYLL